MENIMNILSEKEQSIVLATIRLWNVNAKAHFIPDYELHNHCFKLCPEEMRNIRDIVQEIKPRKF